LLRDVRLVAPPRPIPTLRRDDVRSDASVDVGSHLL
jgi:hypothetical protein